MLLPPFNFPENIVLLITDTLPSPASFLLHKSLSSHLKSSSSPKSAIVVSVSEDLAKWKAIASRSVRPRKKSNYNCPYDSHRPPRFFCSHRTST